MGESTFGQDPIQNSVTKKCGKLPNSSSPEQLFKISTETYCTVRYKQPLALEHGKALQ